MTQQLNTSELISATDLKLLNELAEKIHAASQASGLLYMTDNQLLNSIAKKWAMQISELRKDIKGLADSCNELD